MRKDTRYPIIFTFCSVSIDVSSVFFFSLFGGCLFSFQSNIIIGALYSVELIQRKNSPFESIYTETRNVPDRDCNFVKSQNISFSVQL